MGKIGVLLIVIGIISGIFAQIIVGVLCCIFGVILILLEKSSVISSSLTKK